VEEVEVRRSCLEASDVVGDAWESRGEPDEIEDSAGDTARRLVGDDEAVEICAGAVSAAVVSGARGVGFPRRP